MLSIPFNSVFVGLFELFLASMVFHRAIPTAFKGIPVQRVRLREHLANLITVFRAARSLLDFLCLPCLALKALSGAIALRIDPLKFWALGFALGLFGIHRAFGRPGVDELSWMVILADYCLIAYVLIRLHGIRADDKRKWGSGLSND